MGTSSLPVMVEFRFLLSAILTISINIAIHNQSSLALPLYQEEPVGNGPLAQQEIPNAKSTLQELLQTMRPTWEGAKRTEPIFQRKVLEGILKFEDAGEAELERMLDFSLYSRTYYHQTALALAKRYGDSGDVVAQNRLMRIMVRRLQRLCDVDMLEPLAACGDSGKVEIEKFFAYHEERNSQAIESEVIPYFVRRAQELTGDREQREWPSYWQTKISKTGEDFSEIEHRLIKYWPDSEKYRFMPAQEKKILGPHNLVVLIRRLSYQRSQFVGKSREINDSYQQAKELAKDFPTIQASIDEAIRLLAESERKTKSEEGTLFLPTDLLLSLEPKSSAALTSWFATIEARTEIQFLKEKREKFAGWLATLTHDLPTAEGDELLGKLNSIRTLVDAGAEVQGIEGMLSEAISKAMNSTDNSIQDSGLRLKIQLGGLNRNQLREIALSEKDATVRIQALNEIAKANPVAEAELLFSISKNETDQAVKEEAIRIIGSATDREFQAAQHEFINAKDELTVSAVVRGIGQQRNPEHFAMLWEVYKRSSRPVSGESLRAIGRLDPAVLLERTLEVCDEFSHFELSDFRSIVNFEYPYRANDRCQLAPVAVFVSTVLEGLPIEKIQEQLIKAIDQSKTMRCEVLLAAWVGFHGNAAPIDPQWSRRLNELHGGLSEKGKALVEQLLMTSADEESLSIAMRGSVPQVRLMAAMKIVKKIEDPASAVAPDFDLAKEVIFDSLAQWVVQENGESLRDASPSRELYRISFSGFGREWQEKVFEKGDLARLLEIASVLHANESKIKVAEDLPQRAKEDRNNQEKSETLQILIRSVCLQDATTSKEWFDVLKVQQSDVAIVETLLALYCATGNANSKIFEDMLADTELIQLIEKHYQKKEAAVSSIAGFILWKLERLKFEEWERLVYFVAEAGDPRISALILHDLIDRSNSVASHLSQGTLLNLIRLKSEGWALGELEERLISLIDSNSALQYLLSESSAEGEDEIHQALLKKLSDHEANILEEKMRSDDDPEIRLAAAKLLYKTNLRPAWEFWEERAVGIGVRTLTGANDEFFRAGLINGPIGEKHLAQKMKTVFRMAVTDPEPLVRSEARLWLTISSKTTAGRSVEPTTLSLDVSKEIEALPEKEQNELRSILEAWGTQYSNAEDIESALHFRKQNEIAPPKIKGNEQVPDIATTDDLHELRKGLEYILEHQQPLDVSAMIKRCRELVRHEDRRVRLLSILILIRYRDADGDILSAIETELRENRAIKDWEPKTLESDFHLSDRSTEELCECLRDLAYRERIAKVRSRNQAITRPVPDKSLDRYFFGEEGFEQISRSVPKDYSRRDWPTDILIRKSLDEIFQIVVGQEPVELRVAALRLLLKTSEDVPNLDRLLSHLDREVEPRVARLLVRLILARGSDKDAIAIVQFVEKNRTKLGAIFEQEFLLNEQASSSNRVGDKIALRPEQLTRSRLKWIFHLAEDGNPFGYEIAKNAAENLQTGATFETLLEYGNETKSQRVRRMILDVAIDFQQRNAFNNALGHKENKEKLKRVCVAYLNDEKNLTRREFQRIERLAGNRDDWYLRDRPSYPSELSDLSCCFLIPMPKTAQEFAMLEKASSSHIQLARELAVERLCRAGDGPAFFQIMKQVSERVQGNEEDLAELNQRLRWLCHMPTIMVKSEEMAALLRRRDADFERGLQYCLNNGERGVIYAQSSLASGWSEYRKLFLEEPYRSDPEFVTLALEVLQLLVESDDILDLRLDKEFCEALDNFRQSSDASLAVESAVYLRVLGLKYDLDSAVLRQELTSQNQLRQSRAIFVVTEADAPDLIESIGEIAQSNNAALALLSQEKLFEIRSISALENLFQARVFAPWIASDYAISFSPFRRNALRELGFSAASDLFAVSQLLIRKDTRNLDEELWHDSSLQERISSLAEHADDQVRRRATNWLVLCLPIRFQRRITEWSNSPDQVLRFVSNTQVNSPVDGEGQLDAPKKLAGISRVLTDIPAEELVNTKLLLQGLGTASRFHSRIEASLQNPDPFVSILVLLSAKNGRDVDIRPLLDAILSDSKYTADQKAIAAILLSIRAGEKEELLRLHGVFGEDKPQAKIVSPRNYYQGQSIRLRAQERNAFWEWLTSRSLGSKYSDELLNTRNEQLAEEDFLKTIKTEFVRTLVLLAIREIDDPRAEALLFQALHDSSPEIRFLTIQAWNRKRAWPEELQTKIQKLIANDPVLEVREEAQECLKRMNSRMK